MALMTRERVTIRLRLSEPFRLFLQEKGQPEVIWLKYVLERAVWLPNSDVSSSTVAGGRLSLRNDNAQVGETYAMIKARNKLTG